MADAKSTMKVIDSLKSEIPTAAEISKRAKKKKKKMQGKMNNKAKTAEEEGSSKPVQVTGVY